MKRILILISIIFLAGCASKFDVEKANTYLLTHPDRPAEIKEAISVGKVVQGMNEEEVTICMGKPDTISTTQRYPLNYTTTIWGYFDWAASKSKRVFILFNDGAVAGINEITQTGTLPVNSRPLIMPANRAVNPGPVMIPPANRKCSSNPK